MQMHKACHNATAKVMILNVTKKKKKDCLNTLIFINKLVFSKSMSEAKMKLLTLTHLHRIVDDECMLS